MDYENDGEAAKRMNKRAARFVDHLQDAVKQSKKPRQKLVLNVKKNNVSSDQDGCSFNFVRSKREALLHGMLCRKKSNRSNSSMCIKKKYVHE